MLVLIQRIAGNRIDKQSWPGCKKHVDHPQAEPFSLPPVSPWKRVTWPIPQEAATMLDRLLQLHPSARCSAAGALTCDYMRPFVGERRRLRGKQAPPATPWKSAGAARSSERDPALPAAAVARPTPGAARPRQPDPALPILQTSASARPIHTDEVSAATVAASRCTCPGSCGRGASQHPCLPRRKGAVVWYGPCQSPSEPGQQLCRFCRCSEPDCLRIRRRSAYCSVHREMRAKQKFSSMLPPALLALRTLQHVLPRLLPADLQAFLQEVSVRDHPCVLTIAAQLWSPHAVRHFMSRLRHHHKPAGQNCKPKRPQAACRDRSRKPQAADQKSSERARKSQAADQEGSESEQRFGWDLTPAKLAMAVLDTTRHMAHMEAEDLARERASMQEGGICRLLGIRRVAARMGLITKAPNGKGDLDLNGTAFTITKNHTKCQEMLQMEPWPRPSSAAELADMLVRADGSLRSLGPWAQMGSSSTYLAPHVLRKIAILFQQTCLPDMNWAEVPRHVWSLASPDQSQHLAALPKHWSSKQIADITPNIPLIQWSMWACLLDPALRLPGAQEWLASRHAAWQFAATARELEHAEGAAPTPSEVIKAALEKHRARSD